MEPEDNTEIFRRTTAARSIADEARLNATDAKRAAYSAMVLAALACLIGIAALIRG